MRKVTWVQQPPDWLDFGSEVTWLSDDGKVGRFVGKDRPGQPDEEYYFLPETRNVVQFDTLERALAAAYGSED